jgi:hypothetical protein
VSAEPLRITRVLAVRALHQGVDAADAGEPVLSCPYSPNGDLAQQFATHWWVKGWRRRTAYLRDTDLD